MSNFCTGVVLAVLCAVVEGIGQVSFKVSVLPNRHKSRWVGIGIGLFAIQGVFYLAALRSIEVGRAFTIGSVSMVVTTMLSRSALGEFVGPTRWLGVVLIVIGTSIVTVSP